MVGFSRAEFPCIQFTDLGSLKEYFSLVRRVFEVERAELSSLQASILDVPLADSLLDSLTDDGDTDESWIQSARSWMEGSKFFFNPNSLLQFNRNRFDNEDAQRQIARISQARRRIWRHLEHYEALKKGSPNGIFREINLKDTIEHVIALDKSKFRQQYSHNGIQLDIENIVFEVDYKRVLTALGELIRNAVFSTLKFSERGRFRTFYSLRDFSQVRICAKESEGIVVLSIVDNGIGIPAENFHKIVRYGVSISDRGVKFGGLGVGLPTSILTIEEMGGSLSIESDVSVGTTVTIRVPKR